MKQKSSPKGAKRKLLWSFAAAIVLVAVLLYFEQIAVIYVLATLGLVALLFAVAIADLEKLERKAVESEVPPVAAAPPAEEAVSQQTTAAIREGG